VFFAVGIVAIAGGSYQFREKLKKEMDVLNKYDVDNFEYATIVLIGLFFVLILLYVNSKIYTHYKIIVLPRSNSVCVVYSEVVMTATMQTMSFIRTERPNGKDSMPRAPMTPIPRDRMEATFIGAAWNSGWRLKISSNGCNECTGQEQLISL
jgi:hypothetical protein